MADKSEKPIQVARRELDAVKTAQAAISKTLHDLEAATRKSIDDVRVDTRSAEALRIAREALEKLSRLGNEPHLGNSDGNRIAQAALAAIDALKELRADD